MEVEHDVDHRQSRPDQHDVVILLDARQAAAPRVGDVAILRAVARLRLHREGRREIADTERGTVDRVPCTVRGLQFDRRRARAQARHLGIHADHRGCRMRRQTGRQGRAQILTVQASRHEGTARLCVPGLRTALEPLDEMLRLSVVRAHVADTDIQQMLVVRSRIGDAAAERRGAIEQEDPHRNAGPFDEVNGQHGASEAAPHDAECGPCVFSHGSPQGPGVYTCMRIPAWRQSWR